MADETIELTEVQVVLDGLSSPTDEQLMQAVRGYSDGAIASAAAKLALAGGGGGGSLPAWWTVDSTPGAESVEFAGAVTISPSNPGADPLQAGPLHVEAAGVWIGQSGVDTAGLYVADNVEVPSGQTFQVTSFDATREYFSAGLVGIAWTGPVEGRFFDDADTFALLDDGSQGILELLADGSMKLGPYATGANPSRPVLTLYAVGNNPANQPGLVVHDAWNEVDVFTVGPTGAVTISPSDASAPLILIGLPAVDPAVPGQLYHTAGAVMVSL